MDATQENDYLQKITELIYDDNAIVTCTSLSKDVKINICNIQSLLDKYVENANIPGQQDLSWTYVITGININNGISVILSKEDELQEKRELLKDVIAQHVYSVQKNGNIDLTALANVDSFTQCNKPLLGSVVSDNAIKRKLKLQAANNNETKQNKVEVKLNVSPTNINKTIQKTGIQGFCTKIDSQASYIKPAVNPKARQKNMMADFFSKSASKTDNFNRDIPKTPLIDIADKTNGNVENNTEKKHEEDMEVDIQPQSINEEDKHNDTKNIIKNTKETPKHNKKSKKRRSESKSAQASKKRKRIIEARDSGSDIFASSESEVEVVPDINYSDDDREEGGILEANVPTKTRRMKQITEEFMDEDGYMNTVQRYVMASDDEDEENKEQKHMNILRDKAADDKAVVKNKNQSPLFTKKEASPNKFSKPSKGKTVAKTVQNQMSITSFFKKT